MKKLVVTLFLAATVHAGTMTFDDLAAIKRVGAPQVSPDGKWIVYDASSIDLAANGRTSAIYLIPATGGASKQLTDGTKQDEGPVWSADGKTIAYVSNRTADGTHQAFLYDVASGQSRQATTLPGGAANIKWMPDGKGLVVVSDIYPDCGIDPPCAKAKADAAAKQPTKAHIITHLLYRHWTAWQEPTRSHIVFVPLNGTFPRDLTPGPYDAPPFSLGGGDEFDISPDGRELVYATDVSDHPEVSTNSDLYVTGFQPSAPFGGGNKPPRQLTKRQGADTSPKYSPDGRYIAWRSQARAGYESDLWELWIYDRGADISRRLATGFNNWIESITWTPDSESILFVAPEKTKEAIYEVGVSDGIPHLLWSEASASNVTISHDGRAIYFDRSSLLAPNEIYALTPTAGGAAAKKLTHENDDLRAGLELGETSDYGYDGAGGTKVQALIVKPPHFDASKKYPAVVLIHGGPQGAWEDGWSYRWNPQMFAARGYVVFMPNPRGSTGYGQQFVEEISGDWGGKAYVDIMNGVDQLAAMPFVDSNRIGAAGASYGGYMIDWILGHTDRFKVLVSHDGVYNLESEYGTTEELWFPEWEFRGNPWDNPELYEKWSPHRFAKNFKTPTLVVQGELDFRVPIEEGLQLFTALQRRGVPSKLLYFPDEGHWVLKPRNSKLWYQTVGDWLDQWLKRAG